MELKKAVDGLFGQLKDLLNNISDEEYSKPIRALSQNSIGQHIRHILELYQCLLNGLETTVVNYDLRSRNPELECNRNLAMNTAEQISQKITSINIPLKLVVCYDYHSDKLQQLETNYFRELAYNIEHTIHHMALIRVGVDQICDYKLPFQFGVASSTVKHRKQCVQ